jgi:hypothetical protein
LSSPLYIAIIQQGCAFIKFALHGNAGQSYSAHPLGLDHQIQPLDGSNLRI